MQWAGFNEIFVLHEYDRAIQLALSQSQLPQINILDCGANTGFFSMRMIDRCLVQSPGKQLNLWLVEALPSTAKELKARMEAISNDNVHIIIRNGLVGKRSGLATLQLANANTMNYVSELPKPGWNTIGRMQQLPYVDLESMVGEDTFFDLVKVDIEGSEFQFIESYPSILQRTQVLVVEFHNEFGSIPRAVERLSRLGMISSEVIVKSNRASVIVFLSKSLETVSSDIP